MAKRDSSDRSGHNEQKQIWRTNQDVQKFSGYRRETERKQKIPHRKNKKEKK